MYWKKRGGVQHQEAISFSRVQGLGRSLQTAIEHLGSNRTECPWEMWGEGASPPRHALKNRLWNKVCLFTHVKRNTSVSCLPSFRASLPSTKTYPVFTWEEPMAAQLWREKELLVIGNGTDPGPQGSRASSSSNERWTSRNWKIYNFLINEKMPHAFMEHIVDWKECLLFSKPLQ